MSLKVFAIFDVSLFNSHVSVTVFFFFVLNFKLHIKKVHENMATVS